jgi:hypothetical protein
MLRRGNPAPEATWGRNGLLALLAGAVAVALVAATGLVLAVYYTLQPAREPAARAASPTTPSAAPGAPSPGGARAQKDALAAAPMPSLDLAAALPGPVTTRSAGALVVPPPTREGPAGVPTGFPKTPEGALAQLAELDRTALQSGTLDGARAVIAQWAAPGGPTPESWSVVAAMAAFLSAAGLSGGGSPQLTLVVTPAMGLVKGQVGEDFVVVCVDYQVDATLQQTQRVAVADCQRMVWKGRRWLIGPGPEAASAPAAWPGSDAAVDVGYRDLRHG